MALIQLSAGYGIQWLVPGIFFVLVTGFLAIQVKAARIHTSVELTPDQLRQGEERLSIDEIVRIYPEPSGPEPPKWQSSRALGELTGVPRGRKGIGLKLTNDRSAQAWARKHQRLRTELTRLVEERIPPESAS
ncbi:membrane protein [Mycolicibacterium moriokaense]|uniref:Membrane protein n=2 Tax=Mycolicibacterium moriokaense TaxID=39691 RepID=A0AAD1M9Y6_9MYCO|nr:membrane protein [Mycolicibacterium moriokaense]